MQTSKPKELHIVFSYVFTYNQRKSMDKKIHQQYDFIEEVEE